MADAITTLKREGLSIILSEQNLNFAQRVSDRAYIIEQGQMRYEGTMQALREDETIRSAYLTV